MGFKVDAYSDKGIKKDVNQDALLVKQASVNGIGNICLGVLCDGMGGLSCGEVASASFVDRMDEWFKTELPELVVDNDRTVPLSGEKYMRNADDLKSKIESSWNKIVTEMNTKLKDYGAEKYIRLGTTVVAIIIIRDTYLSMNVGDSRGYKFDKKSMEMISHDQSYVMQQVELGRMTKEEAEQSDKKSVLLQCIGASEKVIPEFFTGKVEKNNHFLLCSDGFWRKLSNQEILTISPQPKGLEKLAQIVMKRGETDNISGLIISV
ncbi:PP2C family protein-serine/threonine phosphatase [Pseudobutyrivibrio ruminis]|uniref:PP2C family protein-serine/threonine phosphatase n=1 Tax=Pseudobutyrivibrio ruminis TaxID=46206 RepID=UPI0004033018|nr:protein phosphatase 2C domain-containing protein [Pseudobutyrivibrio ruminis]